MNEPGSNEELFSLIIVSTTLCVFQSKIPSLFAQLSYLFLCNPFKIYHKLHSHTDYAILPQDSMMDWDDKMQKECATSFIKPLEMNLINKRNKEKVLRACI